MNGKKVISLILNSVLAGMMIGIGCIVNLSCDNRYIGALLFSLGLFTIIRFNFSLYTGKVGYFITSNHKMKYIDELYITLISNMLGVCIIDGMMYFNRFQSTLREKASLMMTTKLNDTIFSWICLSFLCGLLMFIAVDHAKKCSNTSTAMVFGTVVPVMVFIIAGFNHCIADMFYIELAQLLSVHSVLYIVTTIIGNALGAMLIPIIQKLNK